DRGRGREHDRAVEEDHEEGAAEERKRPPTPGIGSIEHVASAAWCGGDQRVAAFHESCWVSCWIRGKVLSGWRASMRHRIGQMAARAVREVYDRGVAVRQGRGALDHRRAPRGRTRV